MPVLFANSIYASDWTYAGNLKIQSNETFFKSDDVLSVGNERVQHTHFAATRLMSSYQKKGFTFDFHYDLKFQYSTLGILGDGAAKSKQLVDLDSNILEKDDYLVSHRVDRLLMAYAHNNWVIRVGRQAISWGNGFMFNPMDLFNPFSQTAIDKDYKPGDDMLYLQWLFDSGNDLQWVFIPRRSSVTDDLKYDVSSAAIKYKRITDFAEMDVLIARHYDENILGVGIIKSIKESIWRMDVTLTDLKDDNLALMLVTNVDYSWVWFSHNVYGYVEYLFNSIGKNSYEELNDSAISERLQRAELFTSGSQYLATGLNIETTPLTSFSPTFIVNLQDGSILVPINFTYGWKQNTVVTLGGNFSIGKRDTEFGGYQLPSGPYLSSGQSVYVQIANYF